MGPIHARAASTSLRMMVELPFSLLPDGMKRLRFRVGLQIPYPSQGVVEYGLSELAPRPANLGHGKGVVEHSQPDKLAVPTGPLRTTPLSELRLAHLRDALTAVPMRGQTITKRSGQSCPFLMWRAEGRCHRGPQDRKVTFSTCENGVEPVEGDGVTSGTAGVNHGTLKRPRVPRPISFCSRRGSTSGNTAAARFKSTDFRSLPPGPRS